jgi:ABC-type multidrug transport system ATPase subunit
MNLAEKLCDRIGILFHSRLRALGTMPELRERYGKADLEDVFFAAVGES